MEIEGTSLPDWAWHIDRIDQTRPPLDHTYQASFTGQGVDIYIIDSGIHYSHKIFGGRAHFGGFDPTGGKGEDCNGHGTHVAGLAGGNITGPAVGAHLYSIKVLKCIGSRTTGNLCHLVDALDYTIKKIKSNGRPSVISLSLIVKDGVSKSLDAAIERAYKEGITIVTAAGNFFQDACKFSPGSSDYTITVGGTRKYGDRLYRNTNYGKCVDIFAPGDSILSAAHNSDLRLTSKSGTSMATPIVSGVVAMLLEEDPSLTPEQVKEKLIKRSTKDVLDFGQLPADGRRATPNRLVYVGEEVEDQPTPTTKATVPVTEAPTTQTPVPPLPSTPSTASANLMYSQLRADVNLKRSNGFVPTNINSYTSSTGTPLFSIVYTHVGATLARKYYIFMSQSLEDIRRKSALPYWIPITLAPYEMNNEVRVLLVMKIQKNNCILSAEKTVAEFNAEKTAKEVEGYRPVVLRYRTLHDGSSKVYAIYQKGVSTQAVTDVGVSELFTLGYKEKSLGHYLSDITYHRMEDGSFKYSAIFDYSPRLYQATGLHVDIRPNLHTFTLVSRILRTTGRHLVALSPTFTASSAQPGFFAVYWK